MKSILLILSLFIATTGIGQKGYGKIDIGANFLSSQVYPSGALTIGFKPASNTGIGGKLQYVKDFGFLAMGELRGFVPIGKPTISAGVDAGERFYQGSHTFAFGVDGSLLLGTQKTKPFFSIGALFMKDKLENFEVIRYNPFYAGIGIVF